MFSIKEIRLWLWASISILSSFSPSIISFSIVGNNYNKISNFRKNTCNISNLFTVNYYIKNIYYIVGNITYYDRDIAYSYNTIIDTKTTNSNIICFTNKNNVIFEDDYNSINDNNIIFIVLAILFFIFPVLIIKLCFKFKN